MTGLNQRRAGVSRDVVAISDTRRVAISDTRGVTFQ